MNTHRTAAFVTLLSLAACSTGPAYQTRPSGAFEPTVSVQQAEAECKAEAMKATSGMQNWGMIYVTSQNVYQSCLTARGYDRVAVGS